MFCNRLAPSSSHRWETVCGGDIEYRGYIVDLSSIGNFLIGCHAFISVGNQAADLDIDIDLRAVGRSSQNEAFVREHEILDDGHRGHSSGARYLEAHCPLPDVSHSGVCSVGTVVVLLVLACRTRERSRPNGGRRRYDHTRSAGHHSLSISWPVSMVGSIARREISLSSRFPLFSRLRIVHPQSRQ